MVDSILIRSLTEWPRRIHDRETLKKLYHTVFTKISDMLIDIAEQHEIPSFAMEYSLQKIALTKLRGGALFEYWKKFQNYGMQQEVEKVIDALWDMDKDIQHIAYKDREYISQERGLNFEFSSNNWRNLFEMIENAAKS